MVLISQAERSGSLRWVKPSMTRLVTCPGSGAVSQFSTGANSQATGLSVPPVRRYFRYWTASRQTVPTAPASRPAATAVSGIIGFFRTRMAGLLSLLPLAVGQPLAHGAPLLVGGASPDPGGDAVLQRPLQARRPRRAAMADPFGLVDLTQREPGRADREEQVRIGAGTGGIVTPVHRRAHRSPAPRGQARGADV